MTEILIVGTLGIIAIAIGSLMGRNKDKKIQALETAKAADQTQLDALQKTESSLKDIATVQQANATEEQKKEFWNEELNPKSDPNSK